jgi:hypothetical protein
MRAEVLKVFALCSLFQIKYGTTATRSAVFAMLRQVLSDY